ncbi:MAG: GNAT family N-acetyltransferase [Oscillospiraceae bacterium]|nr:GNAT family N-acetyltransferase [Oscillospiraceae bacterium]
MKHTDIGKILQMERICFDEPWLSVSPESILIVENYGYAVGSENELHRIAVLPEFRGRGLAFSLMQRFLAACNNEVFLEVASQNIHAIRLYEKCGFTEISRRRNYYKNDDCIVMRKF